MLLAATAFFALRDMNVQARTLSTATGKGDSHTKRPLGINGAAVHSSMRVRGVLVCLLSPVVQAAVLVARAVSASALPQVYSALQRLQVTREKVDLCTRLDRVPSLRTAIAAPND